MENMNETFHYKVPLDWAILLRTLEMRVSQSSSPCLHEKDVQLLIELAKKLVQANPDISRQLEQFWNLYTKVFTILVANPQLAPYAPEGILIDNWAQIKDADSLAENLVSEFNRSATRTATYASIMATFATHIDRTERIEHFIVKQLDDAVKKFNLTNYDIYAICSVRHKVERYNKKMKMCEWTTDVRAIRNSIAHSMYNVCKVGEDFEISFDNDKGGYHFHEVFSQKDFSKFFDLYTILYKFQLFLLLIIELLPILRSHFLKKPLTSLGIVDPKTSCNVP